MRGIVFNIDQLYTLMGCYGLEFEDFDSVWVSVKELRQQENFENELSKGEKTRLGMMNGQTKKLMRFRLNRSGEKIIEAHKKCVLQHAPAESDR